MVPTYFSGNRFRPIGRPSGSMLLHTQTNGEPNADRRTNEGESTRKIQFDHQGNTATHRLPGHYSGASCVPGRRMTARSARVSDGGVMGGVRRWRRWRNRCVCGRERERGGGTGSCALFVRVRARRDFHHRAPRTALSRLSAEIVPFGRTAVIPFPLRFLEIC